MSISSIILIGGVVLALARLLLSPFTSPTRSIPGPFLARFTRLWYLWKTYSGRFELENIALHEKYGPIFRYAPNEFSISDPAAVKEIYGHGKEFEKTRWYEGFQAPKLTSLFTEKDTKLHAVDRRKFQSAYSMSSVVHYEPFTDTAIELFCQKLDGLANVPGKLVDMGWWFMCFAGDAIALITFSKRYGFLDHGEDQQNLIRAMHSNLTYASLVGLYYQLHPILFWSMDFLARIGVTENRGRATLVNFTRNAIAQRVSDRDQGKQIETTIDDDDAPKDFVEKFLDAHQQNPSHFTHQHVEMGSTSNVVAGADTTAASLSGILYHLLKTPAALATLQDEIDEKWSSGQLSSPVKFKEAQSMTYLQAVIQEALRLHPAVGLPLVRVVPAGGAQICGHHLPGGTSVGVNAWVLHHNKNIYGDDAARFRPERWLDADKETLSAMQRYWIPFGLASRTCIGKNISMLEMCKVLPEVLRRFEFALSPDLQKRDWHTINHWFVIPKDFNVTIRRREAAM